MRKIIFLDFDGVISIPKPAAHYRRIFKKDKAYNWYDLDQRCVGFINLIAAKTGAQVVISSSWRKLLGDTIEEAYTKLRDNNIWVELHPDWKTSYHLNKEEFAIARSLPGAPSIGTEYCRGDEVAFWLNEHQATDYIIFDDEDDFWEEQKKDHLVLCDPNDGLTYNILMHYDKKFRFMYRKAIDWPDANIDWNSSQGREMMLPRHR